MDYFRNNIPPSSEKSSEFEKIKQYQKEIGKFDILSAEEEIGIIKKAQQGDQGARNRIIEANLGFVISVSKQYQNQGLRLRELISVGNIGLINAIKGFDNTKELKFISYAVRWIRASILQALNRYNHHIRIPQKYTTQHNRIKRCHENFMQIEEREPTNDELAEILDMNIDYFTEIHQTLFSRYNPYGEEDIIITDIETDKNLIELSKYEELEKVIDNILNENQAIIIKDYFGFNYLEQNYSLDDIGEKMNLTRERVRQIRDKAIERLKVYYKYEFSDVNPLKSTEWQKILENSINDRKVWKEKDDIAIKNIITTRTGEIRDGIKIEHIYEPIAMGYTKKNILDAIDTLFSKDKGLINQNELKRLIRKNPNIERAHKSIDNNILYILKKLNSLLLSYLREDIST